MRTIIVYLKQKIPLDIGFPFHHVILPVLIHLKVTYDYGESSSSCHKQGIIEGDKDLKVHKNENFFGFDFEFCSFSLLFMHK